AAGSPLRSIPGKVARRRRSALARFDRTRYNRSAMEPSEITTREFVIGDYDRAIALWNDVEGVEICEGDSREEVREYLERNPKLSRVAEENGTIAGAALCGHDG